MKQVLFVESDEKLQPVLKKELAKVFSRGESIAVKLHMGEPGNKTSLRPEFVKKIIDVLKELGVKPFLFDSPVVYPSPRNTEKGYLKAAVQQGFTEDKLGCPIVISDEYIEVKGKALIYQVCKKLVDAGGVLVLTHLKGHFCSGFGGSIKNLGMGALTKKTKGQIHGGGAPKYLGGCRMCGACEKSCPLDNIRYADNRPYFDKNWCCSCSDCVYACKFGAINTSSGFSFDFLLSEGAGAALKNFKKAYFVNALKDITKHCDCNSDPGPKVFEDVGFLLSPDIVAIDKASMDLINQRAGEDFFQRILKKSPIIHIREAEKQGMGSTEYKLETID